MWFYVAVINGISKYLLTINCCKYLVRNLFRQVKRAPSFAQLEASPVAILIQEHRRIELSQRIAKRFVVIQRSAHVLRDSNDYVGHIWNGVKTDVGGKTPWSVVRRPAGRLKNKGWTGTEGKECAGSGQCLQNIVAILRDIITCNNLTWNRITTPIVFRAIMVPDARLQSTVYLRRCIFYIHLFGDSDVD